MENPEIQNFSAESYHKMKDEKNNINDSQEDQQGLNKPLPTENDGSEYVPLDEEKKVWKKILRAAPDDALMPSKGNKVSVHYTGKLWSSGKVFDSSVSRGEPFSFTLSKGEVIKGWDISIAHMKKGEQSSVVIHSNFGYGESGSPPTIPSNATLEFTIELLDFYAEPVTSQEKIAAALKGKDEANELFKKSQYLKALEKYKQAFNFIEYPPYSATPEEKSEINELKEKIILNLMITSNKLSFFNESLTHRRKLTEEFPGQKMGNNSSSNESPIKNTKIIYNEAVAYHGLGDLDQAVQLLEKAKKIIIEEDEKKMNETENENNSKTDVSQSCSNKKTTSINDSLMAIDIELARIQKTRRTLEEKEKSLYGKIFS